MPGRNSHHQAIDVMEKMRTLILSMVIILTGVWSISAQTLPKSSLPTSGSWGTFAGVVNGSGEVKLTDDISMVGVIRVQEGKILKITVDADKATKNNITISNTGIGVWVEGDQSAGSSGRSRMFTVKGKSADGEYGKLIIEAPEGYTITLDGGRTNGRTLSEAIANEGILELKNVVIQNVDGAFVGGGAILTNVSAASTTVENCTFTNCHTIHNGGAISVETAATTTLTGCTFQNCTSGSVGGGIYITSSAPTTITGCTFENCESVGNGGAINITTPAIVTLDGCNMKGCTSGQDGGALYLNARGTATINCTISDCRANSQGGGIFLAPSSEVTLDRCTISGCNAYSQGGGIYLTSSQTTTTFENGKISGCTSQLGSAIMLMGSGALVIMDSDVENCISGGGTTANSGGAIRTYGNVDASLYLTRVNFTGNQAKRNKNWDNTLAKDANGGALFWNARGRDTTKCVINGCTFSGNSSQDNGGAIKSQATLVFSGAQTEITGNTAPVGAGLYIEGYQGGSGVSSARTINYDLNQYMYIHDNIAPAYQYGGETISGRGAGVHLYFGPEMTLEAYSTINLNMVGARIENNHAGGRIQSEGGVVSESASAVGLGGGLYFENTSLEAMGYDFNILLNYGTVTGNTASRGAGIYVSKGSIGPEENQEPQTPARLQQDNANTLTVSRNVAVFGGGGICVVDGSLNMPNGTITLNSVSGTGNGGGVYVENGNFTIGAGEVSSNALASGMGAGVYVTGSGELGNFTMRGGTINNNTNSSNNGGGVYVDGGNFNLESGSITTNSSGKNGGGVYINGGNFTLNSADGSITSNSAANGGGVFLNNGDFSLVTGTISGNTTTGNGAGVYLTGEDCIYVLTNGTISQNTASNGYGGGVYLENGSFVLAEQSTDQGLITQNSAARGGGVFISAGGNFTMNGGQVVGNSAKVDDGGGVFLAGGAFDQNGGSIKGNVSVKNGGGVCIMSSGANSGSFTMDGGSIEGNGKRDGALTTQNGGGVYIDGGSLTVTDGLISDNGAQIDGGGLYILNGAVNMTPIDESKAGGIIQNNECNMYGGGVYVFNSSDEFKNVSFTGGTLQENRARYGGGICVNGKINLTIGNVEVAENEAINGGGVCLLNNAKMTFGAGQIKNNRAHKSAPENETYSNRTAFEQDITTVEGIGGGVYLNSNTTLIFNATSSLGLFGNLADNAADEIFANGSNTSVNLPDVTHMGLDNYPGAGNLKWIKDYITNDTQYTKGPELDVDRGSNGNNMRYRDMLANNIQDIPQLVGGIGEEDPRRTGYICFALGYEVIYIELVKEGLAANESAIFTFENTNNQKFRVIMTGNGSSEPITKKVAVTYGTWTVTETPWSWTYAVKDENGADLSGGSITKDVAEVENRTFTFKGVKKETLPLYNESVHIIEAL